MSVNYPHLAEQVFNTPLMVRASLAETISKFLAPRLFGHAVDQSQEMNGHKSTNAYPIGDPEVGNRLAVIAVHGVLVQRSGTITACEELMSYERLQNQITRELNNDQTLEIVLDFNSGGGAAQAAFECARFIKEASKQKPIHAIINFNAYSAAYLLASACTSIYISDTAGVGSIGVYYKRLDLTKHYEQNGIVIHTFSCGGTKVFNHPDIEMTEEERAHTQASIQQTYEMFVEYVAEFRGIDIEQVKATEADTYQGKQALDHKLADFIMTPQQAINQIAQRLSKKTQRSIQAQALALTV